MKTFVPIFMTARCKLFENEGVLPVTVLVPDMDELLAGPPNKPVAVEYDGDIHYTTKGELSDVSFATRKGTEARPMFVTPGSGECARYSRFDREIIARIRGGESGIVLDKDEARGVYILPALLPDGRVEYQVSNGLDARRSESCDFYCYRDAVVAFEGISRLGWKEWYRQ